MRIRLPFLCSIAVLFLSRSGLGQCGYSPTIHTNKDYCVGSSLIATSTHALQNIVWYRDGQPVKTAVGTQSLASTPDEIQLWSDSLARGLNDLGTDDAGNIYFLDEQLQEVLKWTPGAGSAVSVIVGPDYRPALYGFFVDGAGDVFLMSGDSSSGTATPPFIVESPAGRRDSVVRIKQPAGQPFTYGSAHAMTMDCKQNFYILSLTPYITQWPPGAAVGTVVMTDANVPRSCGETVGFRIRKDQAGNLFFLNGINVMRLSPGSNTPVAVTAYTCQGNALLNVTDFWLDANDTLYVSTIIGGSGTAIVYKWAPGASTGQQIITSKLGEGIIGMPILMDVRGNIFMFDDAGTGILEFRRFSSIDSAFTPTDTGAYHAVVTDIQGYVTVTDTIHINSPTAGLPSISIGATATSTPVCTPITFTADVTNPGPDPSYQWIVSGVPAGGDSTTYSNNLFANGDQVYCILAAQAGCAGLVKDTSNVIQLSIDPHGAAAVTISTPRDSICEGNSAEFTATVVNGSSAPVFEWLLNGIPTGDDSATFTRSNFSNGDVVTCLITSDDACGLAKSNSIPILVSIPPVIARDQIFTIPYGQSLTLTPAVSGGVFTWLWSPATGLSDPHIADPVADPAATTLYTLTVEAAGGCGDTATILVNVYTPLAMPNAFTPNGDGRNDRLYVLGGPVNSIVEEFAVFNRWGQMVFRAQHVAPGDASAGWDGRIQGAAAPPGAYVYMVRMKFADGSAKQFTGTVLLIR